MLKRLAKSPFILLMASYAIGAYIRLVYGTTRWTLMGREYFESAVAQNKGVILAFWHGRLLMGAAIRKETDLPVYMLISAHRDGEIIAKGVRGFGIEFIRGSASNPKKASKNKHGASAIAQMIAALEEGSVVGFTPDGPKGPRETVKPGVIKLAQMSGAPIIPAAYSVSRGTRLSTWDRFLLAAPLSKGYYRAGPPITVPASASPEDLENIRLNLERALKDVTQKVDMLAGRSDLEKE
ncbi:lysophospholipid acyltransferase family protein [Hyphococcus formosus]|uniref:lysophospholipid acyltransferase family protein n=1 Tax=Hyphococcus formosus TaxID=3143534 RepID=UPI00398A5F1C